MSQPQPVWPLGVVLGEGPVWIDHDPLGGSALWFVEIKAPAVHRFDPATACGSAVCL